MYVYMSTVLAMRNKRYPSVQSPINLFIYLVTMSPMYGGWFVPFRIIVFSGQKGKKAPREDPPNGDFFVFCMATFRTATLKYDTFHALRFRLLFVVSLPGGAKGHHAKTRQNHRVSILTLRPRQSNSRFTCTGAQTPNQKSNGYIELTACGLDEMKYNR